MALYGALLTRQAVDDLRMQHTIEGLFRTWAPPTKVEDGWIIDPRPGPLLPEICHRFGCDPGPSTVPSTVGDATVWRHTLAARGRPTTESTGPGDGRPPRLLFTEAGPILLLRPFGVELLVFDPRRGVVLLNAAHRLPADAPALVLTDAVEAPW